MNILVLDTETSSLDPSEGHLLEVACSVWSVEHKTTIRSYASVIHAASNEAEAVNGIPPAMVTSDDAPSRDDVIRVVLRMLGGCDLVLAHGADFDRQWLPELHGKSWVCSNHDLEWPRASTSRSLTALALAHGLGVSHAHRAMVDVMTLTRLLERAHEYGADVKAMLLRGLRAKTRFVANVSFEQRDLAKKAAFQWDTANKVWWRRMAKEDVAGLGFRAREWPEVDKQ